MTHVAIQPSGLFKIPAPTSAATVTSGTRLLHISGQVAMDEQGKLVGRGDIRDQTTQALRNFEVLVREAGGEMGDVCRITVYLLRREDLPTVMEVRREFFKDPYPATTAVVVSGLANPDWLVEIEGTAVLP